MATPNPDLAWESDGSQEALELKEKMLAVEEDEAQGHRGNAKVQLLLIQRQLELERLIIRESDLRMACSQLHEKLMQLKVQESELMQEKRCLEVQRRAQKDNSEMQTRRRRQRKMWKKLQQGVERLAGAPEVAELQEQLAQWQELVIFRERRASELEQEASRLEQDADFWHFKAEEWRREADAAAWRRQRAAEAMAQTIEAAEEDLEKAKLLRNWVLALPMLASFLTSFWWCYC